MPIRPRITERPRPENDPGKIKALQIAMQDGEIDRAVKLILEMPDIYPRVEGMAKRGNACAKEIIKRLGKSDGPV